MILYGWRLLKCSKFSVSKKILLESRKNMIGGWHMLVQDCRLCFVFNFTQSQNYLQKILLKCLTKHWGIYLIYIPWKVLFLKKKDRSSLLCSLKEYNLQIYKCILFNKTLAKVLNHLLSMSVYFLIKHSFTLNPAELSYHQLISHPLWYLTSFLNSHHPPVTSVLPGFSFARMLSGRFIRSLPIILDSPALCSQLALCLSLSNWRGAHPTPVVNPLYSGSRIYCDGRQESLLG